MASDARLLRASLNGDHDAFARIVRRYQSLVCAITYSGTGDLAASEDLAQETFLAAWQRLASLRDPGALRAWLCAIARNLTTDHLRRRQRDVVADAASVQDAATIESAVPTPAEQAATKEREQLVWAALQDIPETYREPLVLFYREGQSVGRVAREMDLSRDAVKKRLMRGRGMLRDKLAMLVEDTLSGSAPGGTFAAAVLAGIGGTAASKAAGSGTTILGLSLAKAAAVGVLAAGVAVGGGLAVQHLAGGGPETVAVVAAAAPEPAEKAPQQGVAYAERMPKRASLLVEAKLELFLAMMTRFPGNVAPGSPQAEALITEMCMTRDPASVDLASPVWGVSLRPDGMSPTTTLVHLRDADRYVAGLLPEVTKDRDEGGLHVYTRNATKQTLLVDPMGHWAAVSADAQEARTLMTMLQAGEFPAGGFFPGVAYGGMQRAPALVGTVRQMIGMPADTGAAPPKSWAALAYSAMRWASGQVETLAFAAGMTEGEYSLKLQLQPVAGAALAERLAAAKPADLDLLKYMPADSLAVLDLRLPDMNGFVPPQGDEQLGVRVLRQMGNEAALALGRSPSGSAQFILATRVRDANAAAQLANDVSGLLATRLTEPGGPRLPLRLNRTEVPQNGHVVKVWDFDLFVPADAKAKALLRILGQDLRLYEFAIGDTLILAFGDGMFEKVQQILDGSLPDVGHAPRFMNAMAALPAQPLGAGFLEAERLASWLTAMMTGAPELTDEKLVEAPPIALAAHVVGRDVLEVKLRLPHPALRALVQMRRPATPPPPPVAAPPRPLPARLQLEPLTGIHGAALAGDKAEVERLLAGGADVNAAGPQGRTPLHFAAEQGRLEVAQLLLARGANANAEADLRQTPLHLAAQAGQRAVVEALLGAGADVNATDLQGHTPTGLAVQAGREDVANLLREHGGVE